MRKYWLLAMAALGVTLLPQGSALAHPHVWVTVKALMLFDGSGRVTGLRHFWTFDEAYSAFQTQGLGTLGQAPTREQLAPLAQTNMESLAEFGYFTFLKVGGKQLELGKPANAHLDVGADKRVTLTYDLPLAQPIVAKPVLTLRVYDPEFFVQFDFAETNALSFEGAPAGCSNSSNKPKELDAADAQRLKDVANTNESPGENFGMKLATAIMVACP